MPRQWTHREFLAHYLRADMGHLVVLLPRLHALFEPVRFGRPAKVSGGALLALLRSVYQEPALRRLSWSVGADSTVGARPFAPAIDRNRAPGSFPPFGPSRGGTGA